MEAVWSLRLLHDTSFVFDVHDHPELLHASFAFNLSVELGQDFQSSSIPTTKQKRRG